MDGIDPGGEFVCYWHRRITLAAALSAGYDSQEAQALAQAVCDVDKEPHSQDTDPAAHSSACDGWTLQRWVGTLSQAYGFF